MSCFFRYLTLSCLALSLLVFHQTSKGIAQEEQVQDKQAIERIVREYLLENPEVIIEALQAFEARQEEFQRQQQRLQISSNAATLLESEHQVVYGNPDGDVTVVEFFDYNCSFCRRSLEEVNRLVETDPNVKVILKEFPVLGPESQEAARIAIAAAKTDPKKYVSLHKKLLEVRGQANRRIAMALSESLGYDAAELESIAQTPVIEEALGEVYQLANDLGISGTPTFIIGDELIPGAVGYDVLKQKVDAMRKCGKTICT